MSTPTKYVIIHTHAENLEISKRSREMYFATGNVFDIFESPLYSLQPEYFAAIKYRPLTLILVGVRDRYGVALAEGVDVIECSLRDAYQYCLHQRLISETAEGGSTLRTWDVDSIAAGDTDVLAHLRAGNRALGEQNAELRKALRLEKERAAHLRAAAGLVREFDPQIPRTIDTATHATLAAMAREAEDGDPGDEHRVRGGA